MEDFRMTRIRELRAQYGNSISEDEFALRLEEAGLITRSGPEELPRRYRVGGEGMNRRERRAHQAKLRRRRA